MKKTLQKPIWKSTGRNILILSIAFLMMVSTTPAMALASSPTVVTDKNTYNIGDSIYVRGTATPNASVEITLLDPSNSTVEARQTQVPSGGNYSFGSVYTLQVTDDAGNWSVVAYDTSSNMTARASFKVVSLWERISQLENQLSQLQDETNTLNGTVVGLEDQVSFLSDQIIALQNETQNLNSTVETLSSRLSATELSAIAAYGAIVISILSVFVSLWAVRKKAGFIPKRRR